MFVVLILKSYPYFVDIILNPFGGTFFLSSED